MPQLPQVVAAARVDGPVVQQESRVSAAATDITHPLPVEELTFPRLDYDLLVNPAQAELSVGGITPTQHGGFGLTTYLALLRRKINPVTFVL